MFKNKSLTWSPCGSFNQYSSK